MTTDFRHSYGKDWTPKYFYILGICLCTALIITNTIGSKLIDIMGLKFGAGTLMFPVCLIIGDLTSEVYGFRRTRVLIILSLLCFFVFTAMTQIAIALPAAAEWPHQEAFATVFGQSPRVFIAGALAYLAGELTNSYSLTRLKVASGGRYFWWRAMASTIIGQITNTIVFIGIVFGDKLELPTLLSVIANGIMIKVVIEAIVLPITARIAHYLKKAEGIDHFDTKPLVKATD